MTGRPPQTTLVVAWARAVVLAAVAVGTGIVAHVSAAGRLPGPVTLALITVATAAGCVPLLTRPASRLRIVLLTVVGQTWVHAALTLTAGHRGDHAATGAAHSSTPAAAHPATLPHAPASSRGSYYDVYESTRPQVEGGFSIPAPLVHLFQDLTGSHAPMMVVHLLAAAVVGLWLAGGEQALWTTVALLTGIGSLPRPHRLPVPLTLVPIPRDLPVPQPQHLLRPSVVRRGPPHLLAA